MSRFVVIAAAVALLHVPSASATSRAYSIANITGSMAGKAIYCGFEYREFSRQMARVIALTAIDAEDESDATKQAMRAMALASRTGPVGETCSEFRPSFDQALEDLRSTR
jgi:hypothetical protein